jgi:hypothetical protein
VREWQAHGRGVHGRRWEYESMDLMSDLPGTANGNDAFWVVVDRLSKMVHLQPTRKTVSAEQLPLLYEQTVFRLHGFPRDIVSDRDVQFTSTL